MFIVGSIISGLISIGCLIGGIYAISNQNKSRKNAIYTSGIVVGLEKRIYQAGSSGIYCPVVEFSDNTGEKHRFESSFGTMPASKKVGDTVKIYYNPNNLAEAEIESGISKYFVPGCLFLFTIGSCFFSMTFLGLFILYQNMH